MGSPTFSTDHAGRAVIDTSAAINLIATGKAAEIVEALPYPLVAVETVLLELAEGVRRGRTDGDRFSELVAAGHIRVMTLGNPGTEIFESLVVGCAAETLDDGEAATIAYAIEHNAGAIIDERKANRICGERFPTLRLGSTVDLLAHPDVLDSLGRQSLSDAVLCALRLARMHVLPQHVDWVLDLIGSQQAAKCTSLPRFARSPMTIVRQQT